MYDCIVIGSGISGVSFVHYLCKEHGLSAEKILLLESKSRVGGRMSTHHISNVDVPFWVEMGAHTCYNSYTELISLIEKAGLTEHIIPRQRLPYKVQTVDKKLKSIAFEIAYPSLIGHFWRYFTTTRQGKTTKEYFEPIVGKSNYDKLFSKLFRAVISQEAHNYPAQLFLKQRSVRRKDYPRAITYNKGCGGLVEDLLQATQVVCRTKTQVQSIEPLSDRTFRLTTSSGEVLMAKTVVIATEPQHASSLLQQCHLPEVAQEVSSIRIVKTLAINAVVDKKEMSIPAIAGVVPLTSHYLSAVSNDMHPHPTQRAFTFHFPSSNRSFAEHIEIISQTLGATIDTRAHVVDQWHTLPALELQHLQMDSRIAPYLKKSGVFLVGNYFEGMSIEDCVRRAKAEAARWRQENSFA